MIWKWSVSKLNSFLSEMQRMKLDFEWGIADSWDRGRKM